MLHMMRVKREYWQNWAENLSAHPESFHYPQTIEEVQQIIDSCRIRGKTLKVVGASHSFSAVAKPDEEALSLEEMRGLIAVDRSLMEATFWAGTYLYEAAPLLASANMAFENMGDIQEQTIGGAISTGTHGTGKYLASLSNQVVAWTWVDGNGQIRHHRRGDDDLSKALSISLGLLGVLVKVTIRTVPLYSLTVTTEKKSFKDAKAAWTNSLEAHRHIEWFYFPGVETVQVKSMDMIPLAKQNFRSKSLEFIKDGVIETVGFKLMSEMVRVKPRLSRKVTKFAAATIPTGSKDGYYYEMFPSNRLVKFTECEYAIPLVDFEACMEEMHDFLKAHPFYVHFPIECRVSAGEDAFLSPTQGVAVAYLAFHMYKGMDNGPYFKWVDTHMRKYRGRPHFGKLNTLTSNDTKKLYPHLEHFHAVRRQCDPQGIFLTGYMKGLL